VVERRPGALLVQEPSASARATATMLAEGHVFGEVRTAPDVASALGQLRAGGIDVLVVDLALPDAPDVLDHAPPSVPVVALSSETDIGSVMRTYQGGATCFVRTPRNVGEWAAAVRAIEQFWLRRSGTLGPAGTTWLFELPLGATANSVRDARGAMRRLFEGWGLASLAETAELCTSELATNAVLHARSPVLLIASRTPEGVRIEVQDEAPGAVEAGSLETAGERGRGLALVGALASCWGVDQHEGGKSVWFELHA
jgi:anti-sigma regulatory factor (Ser/Thr protein kinase)/CheY-like chemotaxis protein